MIEYVILSLCTEIYFSFKKGRKYELIPIR
nr:MAG TPA: hypothetical protein [Caudoviricetes sp.]